MKILKARPSADSASGLASVSLDQQRRSNDISENFTVRPGFVPRLSAHLVTRTRLLDRLDQSAATALTVVVAPAGFGKTTLLANWARQSARRTAWVSADEHEGSSSQFFNQISTAVAQAFGKRLEWGNVDPHGHHLFDSLSEIESPTTIIIDDYHLIHDASIHSAIVELIEHLPESVSLIIATRTTPPLPLTRLRARGLLRQIDTEQMRFAEIESAEFLRKIMRIELSEDQVSSLNDLMEGWIVGIQLAAIDIQEGAAIDDVISSTKYHERYAINFLCEEVLLREPPEIQDFLLKTSVLERISAPLADFVMQSSNSKGIIERLHAANLFIVPLDDQNVWVRYHHLFRSLLQEQLREGHADEIDGLNIRASKWHSDNNLIPEAVSYALVASDWLNVAELLQRAGAPLLLDTKPFRDWLRALPADALAAQPKLCVWLGWSYLTSADVKSFGKLVQQYETVLTANAAEFAMMQAMVACLQLDGTGSLHYGRHALDLSLNDPVNTPFALAAIGIGQRTNGKPTAAQSSFAKAWEIIQVSGQAISNGTLRYLGYIANAQSLQGRLSAALETIAEVETLAADANVQVPPMVHIFTSRIFYARNHMDIARAEICKALEITRATGVDLNTPLLWQTVALNHMGFGDLNAALTTCDELMVWLRRNGLTNWARTTEALRVSVLLKRGQLDEVGRWLRANSVFENEELTYIDYDRYILHAMWSVFESEVHGNAQFIRPSIDLMLRVSNQARVDGRFIDQGKAEIVLALLRAQELDFVSATVHLNTAAETLLPEGITRPLHEEKLRIETILNAAPDLGMRLNALHGLRTLLNTDDGLATPPPINGHLVLISEREREVLSLLAIGLTNQEIAANLSVSLNTVKTHVKNIYFKLDVHTRLQAIGAAKTAGLI